MASDAHAGKPASPFARMTTLHVVVMFCCIWGLGAWLGYSLGLAPSGSSAPPPLTPESAAAVPLPPTETSRISSPRMDDAIVAKLIAGDGTVQTEDIPRLVSHAAKHGGKVRKHGMLPEHLWIHATSTDAPASHELCQYGICDLEQAQRLWNWVWRQIAGTADGTVTQLKLSDAPPKATLCNVLFNPVHKVAFVKAPKTGSQAVLEAMGGLCEEGLSLAKVKASAPCFVTNKAMVGFGLNALGYKTWEALWDDYTVFTVGRNPYERAADMFRDITFHRHKQDGWCEPPSFELFCAKPYALGLQDLLFSCGDELNDLHMTEMQADCLLDGEDHIAIDFIVRHESMEADYASLAALVNSHKAAKDPPLSDQLHKGAELALPSATEPDHNLALFTDCGVRCMDLVRIYFIDDFDVFLYPRTLNTRASVDSAARRHRRRRLNL